MTLDEIIALAGGPSALARIAGVDQSTVSGSWRQAGQVPAARARRISEALDVPLHAIRPDIWAQPNGGAA